MLLVLGIFDGKFATLEAPIFNRVGIIQLVVLAEVFASRFLQLSDVRIDEIVTVYGIRIDLYAMHLEVLLVLPAACLGELIVFIFGQLGIEVVQ